MMEMVEGREDGNGDGGNGVDNGNGKGGSGSGNRSGVDIKIFYICIKTLNLQF